MLRKLLKSGVKSDAKALMELHHYLCMNYGWIPLEEFKKLPIPAVFEMANNCEKTIKEQMKKIKRKK